jgi:hypothetical protein
MVELQLRGPCLFAHCECGGFLKTTLVDVSTYAMERLLANFVQRPLSAVDNCICGHPWWNHLGTHPNPFSSGRGILSAQTCGGFFPVCFLQFRRGFLDFRPGRHMSTVDSAHYLCLFQIVVVP